jgi:hypothetical protein
MYNFDLIEKSTCLFGLEQQGHIENIQKMLKEGKDWTFIGKSINWCPITAREHYEKHHLKRGENYFLLARAIELFTKYNMSHHNDVFNFIFEAEKQLKVDENDNKTKD